MNIDWTVRIIFAATGGINTEAEAREVLTRLDVVRKDALTARQRIDDALTGMDMLQAQAELVIAEGKLQ